MPATLESFSRAPGSNVYLPVSNSTSDILTISPRAVSRVCRMVFNCSDSFARMAACHSRQLAPAHWLEKRLAELGQFRPVPQPLDWPNWLCCAPYPTLLWQPVPQRLLSAWLRRRLLGQMPVIRSTGARQSAS